MSDTNMQDGNDCKCREEEDIMTNSKHNILVIHHNDADGRCAGAIVGYVHGLDYVKYIEADYTMLKTAWLENLISGVERDYDTVNHISKLYIVDFSLPEEAIKRLECVTEVIWIDHHASAKTYTYHHLKGLRDFTDKGRSGCELAWEYCRPEAFLSGEFGKVPTIVKLIGDYDTWRLEYENRCKPLIVALDANQYMPDNPIWGQMFGETSPFELEFAIPQNLIEDGKTMIRYRDGYTSSLRKSFGFETKFEGLNCYALNVARMGSMAFAEKMKDYDACLMFVFDGTFFTVSMYSEKSQIDCSIICKKHGGGGHKGASGFTCETLPFKKESQ